MRPGKAVSFARPWLQRTHAATSLSLNCFNFTCDESILNGCHGWTSVKCYSLFSKTGNRWFGSVESASYTASGACPREAGTSGTAGQQQHSSLKSAGLQPPARGGEGAAAPAEARLRCGRR